MPFGVNSLGCLCIVDHRDKPVPVSSDVKDHVVIHGIGVLKDAANFRKIVPANCLDDCDPCFDFVRCIRIAPHRFAQMLARDDCAHAKNTSQYVKLSRKYIVPRRLTLFGR
jgi:hypothetical protein